MKTLFAYNEKFSILWSLLLAAGLALSACSDDETAGGSSEDENTVAIENMTIMGVSQKGPFVRGSTVTANELLDGKTLKQTGNTFAGSIRSNDGLFDIKSVKLASQYAYMVVNGFYRNEVTGEESSAPITLQALTDLTLRSEANINLLTHLEYNRVVNLVTLGGLSVRKAKAQAESEVMKAFYIDLSLENNFEDLNIFSAGDANAALLAVSIMMQGDLAEAKFSTRLADFSLDLEADGEWNDEKVKAEIADWVFDANYAQIRSNVEGWDLSDEVPPFEKYLNNFWWQNYGLGECEEEREGYVVENTNQNSMNFQKKFVCNSRLWRIASPLEVLRYSELKDDVNQNCENGASSNYGSSKYVCINNRWVLMPLNPIIDYDSVIDSRDGKLYFIAKIGTQIWMAQNVNYEIEGSKCGGGEWYTHNEGDCDLYGRLYNGKSAKLACPQGFHLPSSEEYEKLFSFAGGKKDGVKYTGVGEYLKSKSPLWLTQYDVDKNDKFGFSAIPAGVYYPSTQGFDLAGVCASFRIDDDFFNVQLCTEYDARRDGFWWGMTYENEEIGIYGTDTEYMYSVRCVMDVD